MKLESLARLNGFDSSGAHTALFDSQLTTECFGIIKEQTTRFMAQYLKTKSKVVVENLIKQEKMFPLMKMSLVRIIYF